MPRFLLLRWSVFYDRSQRTADSGRPANSRGGASMLKSIDPILNADVLYALRAMGHGDDLVICDTNFPADSVARQTVLGRLLRVDNVTAARVARAVLSVMPLDSFVENPALRMEIVGKPGEVPPVQAEVQKEMMQRRVARGRWVRSSVSLSTISRGRRTVSSRVASAGSLAASL
jgi:L-fucose mutarotase/ribose pyranase (RbsD/FucU family)